MIVVSDTTPIISLVKAGQLDLLEKMFGRVMIPEAVFQELTTNRIFADEANVIRSCTFIYTEAVKDRKSVDLLRKVTGLDAGESEAIIMADERESDLLLMDERKGRRVAKQMGLTITGTVGILIQAFDERLLAKDEIEQCLDKMKSCGIRISDALLEVVLKHISV